jgi:hypothetical protein
MSLGKPVRRDQGVGIWSSWLRVDVLSRQSDANRLAVDQEPAAGQRPDRFDDERKPRCEIVALPRDQPNTGTVAPGHDPHPVVLDLVKPPITRGRPFGGGWQARSDANTQHTPVINPHSWGVEPFGLGRKGQEAHVITTPAGMLDRCTLVAARGGAGALPQPVARCPCAPADDGDGTPQRHGADSAHTGATPTAWRDVAYQGWGSGWAAYE